MTRTAVIGAGMSGLVRAWDLSRRGEDVVLLESSDHVGGLVRTREVDGFLLELGPNTVRPTPELWRLVEELGLTGQALMADPKLPRYIYWKGSLHALPMSPGSLVGTSILSPGAKLRLLTEPLRRRGTDPEESVHSFFSRRLGPEIADRFIEPFIGGIFAGSSKALAVAAAFPTMDRWEKDHGSLLRGAIAELRNRPKGSTRPPRGLLSFREGLCALPKALAAGLGGRLLAATRVESLSPRPEGGWTLSTSKGHYDAERVVLAAPAAETARLLEPLHPEGAQALHDVPHPFLAVVHLTWPAADLARSLHGFGHLAVPEPGRRVLGAVWSSSLFPGRAPAGQALVTAFLGGARDPEAARLNDEEILDLAGREVGEVLGARSRPRVVLLTRYERAIPQYTSGHLTRMRAVAAAEERLPGLTLLGNYRGGISVGDVVKNARSAS
jgi:oxygen-dependent protoporphyrinogen oxidase